MGSSGGNAETALALSAVTATGGKYSKLLFQTSRLEWGRLWYLLVVRLKFNVFLP